jgi:hypothetical protein
MIKTVGAQMTENNYYQCTLAISVLDATKHTGNSSNTPLFKTNFDNIFELRRFQNIYKMDITLKSLHKKWSLID